jgi:hypothetical protein
LKTDCFWLIVAISEAKMRHIPILVKGPWPAPGFVDIRRATRKQYSADEKIRIVLEGLRGEDSIGGLAAAFVRRRAKAEDKAT